MLLFVYFWRLVLFVADLFHPVHCLAVELFLNSDVRYRVVLQKQFENRALLSIPDP